MCAFFAYHRAGEALSCNCGNQSWVSLFFYSVVHLLYHSHPYLTSLTAHASPLSHSFLKSRPNMEEFLGQLLHFQHFRQFINGRIEKLKGRSIERDLFDNEVLAYEEGEYVFFCGV